MLQKITVKNFKSLKDISVEMSHLNLFTGMNGMGKSSLIQVFLLLRQSFVSRHENKLFLNGSLVEIGSVKDAVCESRSDNKLYFELEYKNKNTVKNTGFVFEYNKTTDDFFILKNKIKINELPILQSNTFQYLNAERVGPRKYNQTNFNEINKQQIGNQGEYSIHYLFENKDNDIPVKQLAKEIIPPNQDIDNVQNDYSLISQLEAWLSEISPDIVARPEWYKDLNLVSSFFAYKQENLPDTSAFKATNVGFGISYVLPVVLSILIAKPGDMVIIENPEAHLHPKGQTVLGEMFAIGAEAGIQFFIETHSDHIFDGIRIAAKQKKITPKNINVLFFDRDTKEHISTIEKIHVDSNGLIDKMPKNFFDQFDINLSKLI